MASSSDSEEDIGISCRKRAIRGRSSFLEEDSTDHTKDLFRDRTLYAAEGESSCSESECGLDKLKSSFAAKGECDEKRGCSKASKQKEMRKMRSETQRVLRGSPPDDECMLAVHVCAACALCVFLPSAASMNMPSYQPKKKSLDDFLVKLQNQKLVPFKGPSAHGHFGEGQPLPLTPPEQPQTVQLPSEVDHFRYKFAHHLQVQDPRGRSHSQGGEANRGACGAQHRLLLVTTCEVCVCVCRHGFAATKVPALGRPSPATCSRDEAFGGDSPF